MKVSEKLFIKNFYTVKKFDWEIKEFNVLTGGMGSGKSVCIKLLWFCERILHTLFFYGAITKDDLSSEAIDNKAAATFEETFYKGDFDYSNTEIKYLYSCNGSMFDLQAVWDDNKKRLKWSSDYLDSHLKKWQDNFGNEKTKSRFDISLIVNNHIYKAITKEFHDTFPIGTMFFPASRAIAAITDNTDFLDIFINRFIKNRKWLENQFKNISNEDINKILHTKEIKYDDKEGVIITLQNGCDVLPRYLSSGQQELLYLILLLDYLQQTAFGIEDSPISYTTRTSIYIEEPEAHLFPENQKAILEYIVKTFRLFKDIRKRNDRFFITTHSPYVLNIINNMLYKGYLLEEAHKCPDEAKKTKTLDEIKTLYFPHLVSSEISAHFIIEKNEEVSSMVKESENGSYIYEEGIEKISSDINNDYKDVKNILREFKSE